MDRHQPETSGATYEQLELISDLKAQNLSLRRQLVELNRLLDEQLTRRGQKIGRVQPVVNKGRLNSADVLRRQNEGLRKQNNELVERLHQADKLDQHSHAQNKLGELHVQLLQLRDENLSLENIYSNQMVKLNRIDKIEHDMRRMRDAHNEDLREMKSHTRDFVKLREDEMIHVRQQTKVLNRLDEKLHIQVSVGTAVSSVADMESQLEERERVVETLKYQVAVLSKTNNSNKKRAQIASQKHSRELEHLRAEAAHLKQRLANELLV